MIELSLNNKEIPCSIYLFDTLKSSLFDLTKEELLSGDYNPAFLYELNSIYKSVS